jgi:VanZ family protein
MASDRLLRFNTLWLAIGWLLIFFVVYLSLTPQPLEIPVQEGDKIGHTLAYAVLMLWFSQLYSPPRKRLQVGCALIALAVGLEFAQRYTGYRTFEIADMVAGGAGVMIGWCVAPPRGPAFLALLERQL